MSIHPLTAAKWVCQERGWSATNLEINKILYIAHLAYLGRNSGSEPLVSERFEAWDYGPVLPSVYHRAKAFGNGPVQDVFHSFPAMDESKECQTIRETVNSVRGKTPGELVAITHWENGAWAKHYRPGAKGIVIPNPDIFAEYRARVD